MKHKIQLTRDLVEQIIFGMENQGSDFYLDLAKGLVIESERISEVHEQIHIPLPPWHPSDGFLLMEKFVTSLKNPLYQEELKEILHSGKGVFRKFKNMLKTHLDMERLWFRFKQQEMVNLIIEWLERYEDFLELSELGDELDFLDDLILSDFTLLYDPEKWIEEMKLLDKTLWKELFPDYPEIYYQELDRRYRDNNDIRINDSNHIIAIEHLSGQLVSFLWYYQKGEMVLLRSLYTIKEFRGIGLATQLMTELRNKLEPQKKDFMIEIAPVPHDARIDHLFASMGLSKGPGSYLMEFNFSS